MAVNQRSNKHSNSSSEIKEIVDRPNHRFWLVEPDEVLEDHTVEDYKKVITKWLTNFDGALFTRFTDLAEGSIEGKTYRALTDIVEANTNLTKHDLLQQLNRKLSINLIALNSILTNTPLENDGLPLAYKNLDEFKPIHTFNINTISVTFEDWAKIQLVRYDNDKYHPIHHIIYDISKWSFNDFVLRNIVNYNIPYSDYLISVEYPYSFIVAIRSINKANTDSYNNAFNKFKVRRDAVYGDIPNLDVIVTFEFNIDLYFSHIKYLYKVFETYTLKFEY
jgi:hypothetical protein